jgi:hypothetical protein
MFEESINYKNTDVLLMDPCYSRDDDNDIDSELYCSDLVVDTCADGYYYAIKGRFEDMIERIDEIAENPEYYSLGEFTLDTGRIGVYDYHKAIEEQPELKEQIENKKITATIIRNFTGTITSVTDKDYNVFLVGRTDDGSNDFFTAAF